ncbi:macrophage mannose receptor 1-like isoform X2 [Ptychodera flava]
MGSSYCFEDDQQTFDSAWDDCQSMSGSLVRIDTDAEFHYLAKQLEELTGGEEYNYWIALRDKYAQGVYLWDDDNDATWKLFWDEENGQPVDVDSYDCVAMQSGYGGRWGKVACTSTERYICEINHRCDEGEYFNDGKCLAINDVPPLSQSEATTFCQNHGYDELLSVDSNSSMHQFLMDEVLLDQPSHFDSLWLGNGDCSTIDTNDGQLSVEPCDSEYGFICNRERRCSALDDSFDAGGLCHRVIEVETSYNEAKEYCETESGYSNGQLVKINNRQIADELLVYLKKYHPTAKILLGLKRASENTFSWDDKSQLAFANWQAFQPDNHGNTEDCVIMDVAEDGKWYDVNCESDFYISICQNGSAVDDGVVNGRELDYFHLPMDDFDTSGTTAYPSVAKCAPRPLAADHITLTIDGIKDSALKFKPKIK